MAKRGKVESWPVENLREHEQQAGMFSDMPEEDFKAFVEDIRTNGLREPIEVLPDGTILAGHQRLRAVQKLGYEKVSVIVRHDLANDADAAESYFLNSNLNRRQLDPLTKASIVLRLSELQFGASPRDLDWSEKENTKKWVGLRLGCSSRQVDRLLLAREAPLQIQTAMKQGLIDVVLAGKVALATSDVQEAIVAAVDETYDDEDIDTLKARRREVIRRVKAQLGLDASKVSEPLRPFLNLLKKAVPMLETNPSELDPQQIEHSRPLLERTVRVITALLKSSNGGGARQP